MHKGQLQRFILLGLSIPLTMRFGIWFESIVKNMGIDLTLIYYKLCIKDLLEWISAAL